MVDEQQDKISGERRKRRLERTLIGVSILAIIGLTILQTHVVRMGAGVPAANSILFFALGNLNVILLFFLLLLVLRNLYKLFFEQREFFGHQLRTKLVVAFVSLSLVPTLLLFYTAIVFITTGHDYWFDKNVEKSLVDSLELGQFLADVDRKQITQFGDNLRTDILDKKLYRPGERQDLEEFLRQKLNEYHLILIEVYSPKLEPILSIKAQEPSPVFSIPLPARVFKQAAALQRQQFWVDTADGGEVIRAVWPVVPENHSLAAYLVVGFQATLPIKAHLEKVQAGLESYRQLKKLQDPIKITHYIALTIVALLSVFISTWIAFHLAQGITGPIMELAEGTDKIAKGDYDFTIEVKSTGEIATLVGSFNRMTRDLKAGKTELTRKNIALEKSNTELDQRRRYMETILQNVAAGVISADAQGLITIINHSAEEILKVKAREVLGRPFTEILAPEYRDVLEEMIRSADSSPRGYAERHVRLKINGQGMNLKIHLSRLKDENRQELGLVIVVDDLTELEKAQRMTAWREVARRIAHEIKNPLTPIQLCAQRLRRKYTGNFEEDGQLFDECTLMIIRQVEELKRLVDEFSNFARLPEVNPTPNDLAEIVSETMMLYQEAHKEVEFVFERDPELPVINLDREQVKRALINLLDNAVAAVDSHGRIEINLVYNKLLKTARLEVADDGVGIDPADRARLFEPYFSTKKHGTGLGLAIVSTIVAGHNGYIRVQDNQPHGTRFIIELPARN